MDFAESRTAQNLLKAFAGESQARNRYSFAASIARKEGLEHVAAIFLETADNEKEHAKQFYKHLAALAPSALEIQAGYPVVAGDSAAQLRAAVSGGDLVFSGGGVRRIFRNGELLIEARAPEGDPWQGEARLVNFVYDYALTIQSRSPGPQ